MEKVSIIDIQGVQWAINDQKARNDIITLKAEVEKLRTIEKWEYNIPIYGGNIIARRQGNLVSVTANNIGRVKKITPDIGDITFTVLPERFRPLEEIFFMTRLSGSYQTNVGGTIYPNGTVNYYSYVEVDYGSFSVSYIVD